MIFADPVERNHQAYAPRFHLSNHPLAESYTVAQYYTVQFQLMLLSQPPGIIVQNQYCMKIKSRFPARIFQLDTPKTVRQRGAKDSLHCLSAEIDLHII